MICLTITTALILGLNVAGNTIWAYGRDDAVLVTRLVLWCWILLALPITRFVLCRKLRRMPRPPLSEASSDPNRRTGTVDRRAAMRQILIGYSVASLVPGFVLLVMYGRWLDDYKSGRLGAFLSEVKRTPPQFDCSSAGSDTQYMSCQITMMIVWGAVVSIGWLVLDVALAVWFHRAAWDKRSSGDGEEAGGAAAVEMS